MPDGPFRPGRLFAGDNDEDYGRILVWRSIDGGKSWARRSAGLPIDCEHFGSVDYMDARREKQTALDGAAGHLHEGPAFWDMT